MPRMWFPALWMQFGFLIRCLILLNGKVSRWSIFGVQVSENGTRPSRFLADCNGVSRRPNKSSRISGIVPGAGRRYAYRRRISLPFGIHIDPVVADAETCQSGGGN